MPCSLRQSGSPLQTFPDPMRTFLLALLLLSFLQLSFLPLSFLRLSGAAWAASKPAADLRGKTWLSVEGPTGKPARPGTPVLQSITAAYDITGRTGVHFDVMPQFHFRSPEGNAVMLHRELVETDSAISQDGIRSAPVRIAGAQQRSGATIKGGWVCGPGRYHVTLRAYLIDARGNPGNALQYTIHCHELLIY